VLQTVKELIFLIECVRVPGLMMARPVVDSIAKLSRSQQLGARQLSNDCIHLFDMMRYSSEEGVELDFIRKIVEYFISLLNGIEAVVRRRDDMLLSKGFSKGVSKMVASYIDTPRRIMPCAKELKIMTDSG